MLVAVLVIVWVGVAATALVQGLEYYVLSPEARAFSPLAPVFSPTGTVGQGYGVVGTGLLLAGVGSYALRKRLRCLRRLGPLRDWLRVHIFLCTLGPFLVLLHTTFKFGGIVSVAFWSMALVVASGTFGRYVYARIPKTLNGRFLDLESVAERLDEMAADIRRRGPVDGAVMRELLADPIDDRPAPGLVGALAVAVRSDLEGRARARKVRTALATSPLSRRERAEVLRLVRRRDRLRRQTVLLYPFRRLFRYWHVVHLPLAIVMLLILAVHVAVAILFGYTWILPL